MNYNVIIVIISIKHVALQRIDLKKIKEFWKMNFLPKTKKMNLSCKIGVFINDVMIILN